MRVMLGIEGDRGQSPSLTVKDADGTRMYLDPGMTARAAAGRPEVVDLGDGNLNATFASEQEAYAYVAAMKRKHPGQDVVMSDTKIIRSFVAPLR